MSIQDEIIGKFQALMRQRYDGVDHSCRQRLFDDYDTNGDGLIDSEELETILVDADIGNTWTRGFWVKGVIAKMDTNEDGMISLEEFEAVIDSAKKKNPAAED